MDSVLEDEFDVGAIGYRPRPDRDAFQAMLDVHGLRPAATAFFEDSERNLAPAADLGMTTVLVGAHAGASTAPFVQHRTEKLAPFLATARLRETR